MKHLLCLLCIVLCTAAGCSSVEENSSGGNGVSDADQKLSITVMCRFLNSEKQKNGSPLIGIACVSGEPVRADIGYRGDKPVWIPIKTGIPSIKLKENTHAVKCVWEKPVNIKGNVLIKVTAFSRSGKRGSKTVILDCIRPASKVTFNPFSL